MPRFAWAALSLALLAAPVPCLAQGADEDPDEAEAPAAQRPARERGPGAEALARRSAACRGDATRRNLRGPDLADAVAICIAEARLACLRRAVDSRIRGAARRDYLVTCLGET